MEFTPAPVRFDDIIGFSEIKRKLLENIILPLKFPTLFERRMPHTMCVNIFGAHGQGKSYLAAALSTECAALSCNVYGINVSALLTNPIHHDRIIQVRSVFARASESNTPSVVVVNDLDLIFDRRGIEDQSMRRLKQEFITLMYGVNRRYSQSGDETSRMIILTTMTNPQSCIGLRCLSNHTYLRMFTSTERLELVKKQLCEVMHQVDNDYFQQFVDRLAGYTISDIICLMRAIIVRPIHDLIHATHFRTVDGMYCRCDPGDPGAVAMRLTDIDDPLLITPPVLQRHFEQVLEGSRPSVSQPELDRLRDYASNRGIELDIDE
eukprot:gnl/Dysnectes_brevis/2284_a2684_1977.p1 GENE.gnl/Dysnectes_brevis/2284_a2684_1977~~gnl/Dysnectes_brevis/2284_a2684_1977.p1  ORF type:complete len:322 (+),score=36.77 gnl/Dysnectes_brevis/2284_a2684_1977:91-1056(+)